MCTIKKACDLLSVSKPTIYKHMEKNNIIKGKKLTNHDLKVLEESVFKSKGVNSNRNDILSLQKEHSYELNLLQNNIKELNAKINLLENDNRKLISQLQQSQIMLNESQKQNIELMFTSQKLLENKKKWWKK